MADERDLTRGYLLREILDRLKKAEGVKTDADLAAPLLVAKTTIEQWKHRGSIPWGQLHSYCLKKQISLEWVINGTGPVRRDQVAVLAASEPGAIYHVSTDQDAVYDISSAVYRALREIEATVTPEKFSAIVRLLHREMLDAGDKAVSYAHVREFVRVATA